MENSNVSEGKTTAIISYITVIGLIIAYFMNKGKDNSFANFHINQSFRLFIFAIILQIAMYFIITATGMASLSIISYIPFILMILGLINTVNGKEKNYLLLGKYFF